MNAFESKLVPTKIEATGVSDLATQEKVSDYLNLKILSPKEMKNYKKAMQK